MTGNKKPTTTPPTQPKKGKHHSHKPHHQTATKNKIIHPLTTQERDQLRYEIYKLRTTHQATEQTIKNATLTTKPTPKKIQNQIKKLTQKGYNTQDIQTANRYISFALHQTPTT